ncbi:hypothetical protein [Actinoallomurus rhizosphaericola]|uniref:hypothetical protein n=1 Tax=Actinoallomurus rhizosphaericola TaxID=2952536 RepID=UPI002091706E|nr:hypothetical protein [Actinoallomurus rhizosphaericola]MCO5993801.1 hypothetical protein [Actinoallomurus rhizosphaericola]
MIDRRWKRWVMPAALPAVVIAGWYGWGSWRQWRDRTAVRLGKTVVVERFDAPTGAGWQLMAQHQWMRVAKRHDQLCLDIVAPVPGADASGHCGFDPRLPMSDYWAERDLAEGAPSVYYWGPTPDDVAKVRLSGTGLPTYVVPTRPLPRGHGLPQGRYFLVDADPTGRISGYGTSDSRFWTVRWLDATGRQVPFRPF